MKRAIPEGEPGKYEFNPRDDRKAAAGGYGEAYRTLAVADDSLSELLDAYENTGFDLDRKVITALRTARSANKRAGFLLVLYHGADE